MLRNLNSQISANDIYREIRFSRYPFLRFIPDISVLVVGNQGGSDIQYFKTTQIASASLKDDTKRVRLESLYIYRSTNKLGNIHNLGMEVVELKGGDNLMYVLTSDSLLHCLKIERTGKALIEIQ